MLDERLYQNMMERIAPAPQLLARVRSLGNAASEKRGAGLRARAARRLSLAAVLLVCLGFAVPALAVYSPSVYSLMYAVSPAVAQFFIPVRESCEYDGIRMEVVSAYAHEDTAEIYVTMQDLTGDRIDASMDLYDSDSLHIPFDSIGACEQVAYDPDTKTATFLSKISSMDGTKIKGGKVTFSISCFLSRKQELLDIPLSVDWSAAEENPETLLLGRPRDGYTRIDASDGEVHTPSYNTVLRPGEPMLTFADGFDVTGLGYVDGRLHIQLYTPGRKEFDDHAFLELTDAQGNTVHGDMVYHDFIDERTDGYVDYIDYVFNVSRDALSNYTLTGSFYAAKLRTEGTWQVTFPLKVS